MTYDIIFAGIMFLCLVFGTWKGFINSLFGMGAPVVSIWLSVFFYRKLAVYLAAYINSDTAVLVLSFLIIFILVFLILKVTQQLVSTIFGGEIFRSLDRVLGFIFGLAEGAALIVLVIFVLVIIPEKKVNDDVKKSFTYSYASKYITFPKVNIPKVRL